MSMRRQYLTDQGENDVDVQQSETELRGDEQVTPQSDEEEEKDDADDQPPPLEDIEPVEAELPAEISNVTLPIRAEESNDQAKGDDLGKR